MKISKEEIIKLADSIMIELNEKEINEIEASIEDISTKLQEMLNVQVECDPKIMEGHNINQFNQEFLHEVDTRKMMETLNNFDGTYIKTGKVIDNEE
ncbi:MAG: hypothetical protein ACRC5R_01535 [Mycoplasmatales bacterium]